MSDDFIDSNSFIYLFDDVNVAKRDRAEQVVRAGSLSDAMISHQVVQETLRVITTKIPRPLSRSQAEEFFRETLLPFWKSRPTPELYSRALEVQERYRLSFWDALIVAAALEARCTRLLTEDLQHGQTIEGLRVENPFRDLV